LTALILAALARSAVAATSSPAPVYPQADAVVATIGSEKIRAADLIARNKDKFSAEQQEYQRAVRRLQIAQDRAYHDLLQQQLDAVLDQRALGLEAAARGVSSSDVLAELKVPPATDADARALYESRKAMIKESYEQIAPQIINYLQKQHTEQATRQFYDDLRARHGVVATLPPYRAPVVAAGPARGEPNAPITIVEFGDFQCPYCLQAENTVRTVMTNHPQDVRLVFRHLPLTELHPNAAHAAEAAVCAEQQGKFWEMHDAMFADQNALGVEGLTATAARIGLDPDKFRDCVNDSRTNAAVQADADAAAELGVSSTPSFFINGRPVEGGNVPVANFEAIINDELQRVPARRGG